MLTPTGDRLLPRLPGLLESPMQIIYTLTLMAIGVLPTPREESAIGSWTYTSYNGQDISVSFWPSLSVALSFLSIAYHCVKTVNINWSNGIVSDGKYHKTVPR